MRILITNDDGINAPGLKVLRALAEEVAAGGEVWTVAPAFEQSGVAHCISYTRPTMVAELSERTYAIEGTPADCVLAGVHDILPEAPDLILSGVNRGNNAGENTLYSGTLGAAMEGALQGLPAIALSQFYGPRNAQTADPFEAAGEHGASVISTLLQADQWMREGYHTFYNVNFPPVPGAEVLGTRVVAQGMRPTTRFGAEATTSPSGRRFLWMRGGDQRERSAEGTDVAANLDGYISVTPMRADLTDHAALSDLEAHFS